MPLTYEFIPLSHRTRLSPGHRLIVATGADCQRCPRFGVSVIYPVWTIRFSTRKIYAESLTRTIESLTSTHGAAAQAPCSDRARASEARQERSASWWTSQECWP